MIVRDILQIKGQSVVAIEPDATAHQAMQRLVQHNIGSLVVLDGTIHGIITERDLLRAGAASLERLATARVRDLMTTDVITAPPNAGLHDVMNIMTEHRIRHLPIVDGNRLCGMISIGDVVNALRHTVEAENSYLHAYIEGTPR